LEQRLRLKLTRMNDGDDVIDDAVARRQWMVPRVAIAPPQLRLSKRLEEVLIHGILGVGNTTGVRVIIVAKSENIVVQQLSAYLAFGDRIYGRLTFESLQKYRRAWSDQLEMDVRAGSLLLVLREAIDAALSPPGLILTGLALKYLPDLIRAPASAYRDYEQGRLLRAERQRITERAEVDPVLGRLRRKDILGITSVLARLYGLEQHRAASAQRFSLRSVQEVIIERIDSPETGSGERE
jgi:hypothetical protein